MRLFVAGTSADVARAHAFMRAAEAMGHKVTYDWTASVRKHAEAPFTAAQLTAAAARCIEGVLATEASGGAFILLWRPDLNGALTELGVALTLPAVATVVVGLPRPIAPDVNIFLRLADLYFDNDAEALAWLQEQRR